jgi:probable DNA metabolism protein
MTVFSFDNTFEGLLTLIFESYRLKLFPDAISGSNGEQPFLFSEIIQIGTEEDKAERVWNKIVEKSSKENAHRLYRVFLSELPDTPLLIFNYVRLMIEKQYNIETDFSLMPVLELTKLHRKVVKEAHRIQMFTRFQETAEGSYYASFSPQYNVLPLCIPYFKDRFADQEWIIYDLKRNYGFHYDLHDKKTAEISFEYLPVNPTTGQLHESFLDPEERQFQKLWKKYYNSINIAERKNYNLHRQLLPKRFWRFLPEKN